MLNVEMKELLIQLRKCNVYATGSQEVFLWMKKTLCDHNNPNPDHRVIPEDAQQNLLQMIEICHNQFIDLLENGKGMNKESDGGEADKEDNGRGESKHNRNLSRGRRRSIKSKKSNKSMSNSSRRKNSKFFKTLISKSSHGINLITKRMHRIASGSRSSDVDLFDEGNNKMMFTFDKEKNWGVEGTVTVEEEEQQQQQQQQEMKKKEKKKKRTSNRSRQATTENNGSMDSIDQQKLALEDAIAETLHPFAAIDYRRKIVQFAQDMKSVCRAWLGSGNEEGENSLLTKSNIMGTYISMNDRMESSGESGSRSSYNDGVALLDADLETKIKFLCRLEVEELCETIVDREMKRILQTEAAHENDHSSAAATTTRHHKGYYNSMAPIPISSLTPFNSARIDSVYFDKHNQKKNNDDDDGGGGCIAKSALETWSLYMTVQARFIKVPSDAMKYILEHSMSTLLNDLRNNIDIKLLNPKKAWCLGYRDDYNISQVHDFTNPPNSSRSHGYTFLTNAQVHGQGAVAFPPVEYRMLSVGGGDLDILALVISTLNWLKIQLHTQGVKGSDVIFEVSTFIEELILLMTLELQLTCHIHLRLMHGRRYHWKTATAIQQRTQSEPVPETFITSLVSYMCKVQHHVLSMMDDQTCKIVLKGMGALICELFYNALPEKICSIGYHQILINLNSLEIAWTSITSGRGFGSPGSGDLGQSCRRGDGVADHFNASILTSVPEERMDTRKIYHCLRERYDGVMQ